MGEDFENDESLVQMVGESATQESVKDCHRKKVGSKVLGESSNAN